MNKNKNILPDLYADLASMERTIVNLRNKIESINEHSEENNIKKVHDDNFESTIGNIGEELRKNREGRCWNLFHAARKSGLRYETIQSLEEGKGTVKNLLKYCEGLGISLHITIDNDGKVIVSALSDKL